MAERERPTRRIAAQSIIRQNTRRQEDPKREPRSIRAASTAVTESGTARATRLEDPRVAFQRYRSFFTRILRV